jgi:hypothetical protein
MEGRAARLNLMKSWSAGPINAHGERFYYDYLSLAEVLLKVLLIVGGFDEI